MPTDVFLYSGEASAADIKLSDPTVLRSEGGAPPVTGTLSATLSDATLAASGVEIFTGTLASTLGASTLSASGVEVFTGTLASTLSAATMSASGAEVFTGTLASTLSASTMSASGEEVLTGTLASALSNATSAISGSEVFTGTLSTTLNNATAAAAGLQVFQGGLASSLSSATMAAAGGSYYVAESSFSVESEIRGQRRVVQILRVAWITNFVGTITIELPRAYGSILKVVTIPSITYPPSLNYNVDLLGEDGIDLLGGACNALDSVNKEEVYPTLNNSRTPAFACGAQSLKVSATGGAAAGTVVIYFSESLGEFNACA